jgi:predicted O-linked N-acetylglucosamine transferase (SPINDLY family)
MHSPPSQKDMKILEVLYSSEKFSKLEIETKKLIKKHPNVPTLLNILGFALHKQGHLSAAVINYEQAIFIDPKFVFAHNNLGNVFKDLGKFNEAISKYQDSIKLNPNYAEAYYNQGLVYKKLYRYNKSIESFQHALKIKPRYLDAYFDLGQALVSVGQFEEAIKNFQKVIDLKPDLSLAYNNIFFTLMYMEKDNHNFFLSLAKKFRSSIKNIDKNLLLKYQFENKPKKLRIGFVSGDFWSHPVGYLLLDTLKNLKNKNLELVAYSNFSKKDDVSIKLKSYFNHWHEIEDKKDIEVINQIRKDKINILFDLAGHSAKNRLTVFMNKPAPMQISWAGYPGFVGIPEIDYVIGDRYVTPEKENNFFTEKVYLLPNIWMCFTPPKYEVEIKELPAIKNKYVTFGSFNNLPKINKEVVFLWSKILKAVPKSKIFLKSHVLNDSYFKKLIINNFEKNNINADSIILEGRSTRKEYLACYNKIDIALDPFPWSGGISTWEAIWMGVPVLTKKGYKRFVSHQTESINYNAEMSDWVAKDENEYLDKAIKFASNINLLAKIRRNLRKKTLKLPVFNSTLFAKEFNIALWKIWDNFIKQNQ